MKIEAFSKTYEGRTVLDFRGMEVKNGTLEEVFGVIILSYFCKKSIERISLPL